MPTDRTDTYCVIGAGSSGLCAAKALREHGISADIVEREDEVGGNWNFGKPRSRVYASTHTISSKPFTQYPDFPMPDAFPDYPHHTEILAYLKQYARHFGLYELIEFQTSVIDCEPVEDGRWWDVTVEGPDGDRETRRYGGVVIANGHNWFPKKPDYPGEFTGEAIHAADYGFPEQFEGKRVLVVGAGNTGCDLAVEAGQHADRAFHSSRRGYWYAQKYVLGKPSDQIFDLLLSLNLPVGVLQNLLETTATLTAGAPSNFGLREPDHRFLETHPIVNSLLLYYIGHGEITPKPDIDRFDGQTVHFTDGSSEQIDLVVYSTGYLIRFPFIDRDHLNWGNGRPNLYKNVFSPDYDNLFVIGLIQPDSGQFKLVHWQSVAMAKYIELTRRSASAAGYFLDRFRRNLDEDLGAGVDYKESTRHYVEVQHMNYLRGLADLIEDMEQWDGRPDRERIFRTLDWTFPPQPVDREVVRVEPEGASDRPPILLVHGLGTGAWCWEEFWMPELARRGWPSVALSLRGHGNSGGRSKRWRHTLRQYVHDVFQTIVELDERPVLVGHSMGALVVIRVLELYQARAGVLMCPAPAHGGLGMAARIARYRPAQLLKGLAGADVEIDADLLFSDAVDPARAAGWAARVEQPPPLVRAEMLKPRRLRPSKAPVQVIGSKGDRLIPPEGVRRTADHYEAPLVMYDNIGHAMMLDADWSAPLDAMTGWLEKRAL